jgi:hypothetical protein
LLKNIINNTIRIWNKFDTIFLVAIFVVALFLFTYNQQNKTREKGIYTVAKVTDYKGAESGSSLYIEIFFKGNIYNTKLGYGCDGGCIGKYYFIKIRSNDPTLYPILLPNKEVPMCVIIKEKYFPGWTSIPDCSSTHD